MQLKHRFLAATYHPLKLRNTLLSQLGLKPAGRLRVLLYHDIAHQEEDRFAEHLRWLSRSWRFVSPKEFTAMVLGLDPVLEDCLLLSFDDGFASNRRVAETVLNPMGIRALFFVVSGFVALGINDDWREFVSINICDQTLSPEEVPDHWQNMTWDDLAYLLQTGHSVGAHTTQHARLSQVATDNLGAEIIESADILERMLGAKVDHFAYTFGDLASFSATALAVARTRFKFIYTGLRGDNSRSVPSWAIRRDAITTTDSLSLIGALLEGGTDRLYVRSLSEYESWGKAV